MRKQIITCVMCIAHVIIFFRMRYKPSACGRNLPHTQLNERMSKQSYRMRIKPSACEIKLAQVKSYRMRAKPIACEIQLAHVKQDHIACGPYQAHAKSNQADARSNDLQTDAAGICVGNSIRVATGFCELLLVGISLL